MIVATLFSCVYHYRNYMLPIVSFCHLILPLLLLPYVFVNIFHVLQEYKYISSKRLEYFMTSKPLPQHFTVLVRAIPVSSGDSVSDAVDKYFREYHPSTYLSHAVVHQTGKLRLLLNDAENICSKLGNLKYVHRSSGDAPRKFLGLFGRNDLRDKYQKRLEDVEENVRLEQSDAIRRQSLIKKDREEQSKPEMLEFFSNLVSAYRDPALKPIQRASNSDERTAPLLASI
nr:unnamed protein product [Digitaria exilis]